MNRFERGFGAQGEAKLQYMDGEYELLQSGSYVICAVTGQQIYLDELRYWNIERQEPYASAEVALRRERELAGTQPDDA